MNLFNDNDEHKHKPQAFSGSFEDMMKERAKHLPEFEEHIQEQFKNYNGEMVAVVRIEEDENGDPSSSSVFVGGVASAEASMKMLKALDEAKDSIIRQMAESISEHPEALGGFLGDMLTDMIKKTRK